MAKAERQPGMVFLRNVRASFLRADSPEASVEGGTPKYSGNFLIDRTTEEGRKVIKAVKRAIKEAEAEKDIPDTARYKEGRKHFRKGDEFANDETGELYEGYSEDVAVVIAKNPTKPQVIGKDKSPVDPGDPEYPYSGCYVNALVQFYCISPKDKDRGGLGCFGSIKVVQFKSHAKAFGAGKVNVDDYFNDESDDDDGEASGGYDDDDDDDEI